MDAISERLHASLHLTVDAVRGRAEAGEEACSREALSVAEPRARCPAPLPPRPRPAVASSGVQKRSFVRPGGVASAWQRCVGAQRTVNVRKRTTGDDHTPGAAPLLGGGHVSGLEDMAAFLRQRKRRIVSEAAKLLGPQPEPEPGEELNLVNLPTDLLMKIVCLLRHNELQPLLATSRRLRQAAAAAISVHFNFCTPEPQRDERDAVLAVLRSPSPRYVHAAMLLAREAGLADQHPPAPGRHRAARRRRPAAHPHARVEAPEAMLALAAPPQPEAHQPVLFTPMDVTPTASVGFVSPMPVARLSMTPAEVPAPTGLKGCTRLSFNSGGARVL